MRFVKFYGTVPALCLAISLFAVEGSSRTLPSEIGFFVAGNLTELHLSRRGDIREVFNLEFQVKVKGTRWWMQIIDLDVRAGTRQSIEIEQLGCDGRDIYKLERIPVARTGVTDEKTNRLFGFAYEGTFPSHTWALQRVLWLAFCSGPYLRHGWNVPSIRDPLDALCQPLRSSVELLPGSGLPVRFEQVVPGVINLKTGEKAGLLRFPPPYDKEFVEFTLDVTSVTNLNELYLPGQFEATIYFVTSDFKTNATRIAVTKRLATVTRIAQWTNDNWLPVVDAPAYICDHRFTNKIGRPIMYSHPGGDWRSAWLRRNDPDLQRTISSKPPWPVYGRKEVSVAKQGRRRAVAVALLLAFNGAALAGLFVYQRRQRRLQAAMVNQQQEHTGKPENT